MFVIYVRNLRHHVSATAERVCNLMLELEISAMLSYQVREYAMHVKVVHKAVQVRKPNGVKTAVGHVIGV